MARILGAVVAVIALVAIVFLWQPWKSRQGTAQLPPPREQPAPQPTTPLVSLDEMQSRMADDELVRRAVARAMDALASSEKEPDFVDKDCESDAKAKDNLPRHDAVCRRLSPGDDRSAQRRLRKLRIRA
jgi:hypothetical protein